MATPLPHAPPKVLPPPQATSLNSAASANATFARKKRRRTNAPQLPQHVAEGATTVTAPPQRPLPL